MIWNKLTEKRPLAYKTGMFDGKKSDKVLVADEFGNYFIAEMYEGFLDGLEFCDFYDTRDFELKNIEYWAELESPFLSGSTKLTANLEGMSEDEWINRAPEKISVEDFKKFSNDLFIAVRDRLNSNKAK